MNDIEPKPNMDWKQVDAVMSKVDAWAKPALCPGCGRYPFVDFNRLELQRSKWTLKCAYGAADCTFKAICHGQTRNAAVENWNRNVAKFNAARMICEDCGKIISSDKNTPCPHCNE